MVRRSLAAAWSGEAADHRTVRARATSYPLTSPIDLDGGITASGRVVVAALAFTALASWSISSAPAQAAPAPNASSTVTAKHLPVSMHVNTTEPELGQRVVSTGAVQP